MIKKINIKNFKSIENLDLELGRLNIIIGANASGKTNILEAIVMGAAASANKLEYEFLGNRIRVTAPEFMRNAFPNSKEKEIQLKFYQGKYEYNYYLINNTSDPYEWHFVNEKKNQTEIYNYLKFLEQKKNFNITEDDFVWLMNHINEIDNIKEYLQLNEIKDIINNRKNTSKFLLNELSEFLIYTPELSFLKKFEGQAQITPLGVRGEGLFSMLKQIITNKRKTKQITDIKENLHLLDWFDDFEIPTNLMSNEFKIAIKDRFIKSELNYFDQYSSNEGFLYLLFYLVLFTSERTPTFFAIDNIETGFNPKLCTELIKVLNQLAKKYKKQVIITTHNPAILDGLNLNDNNQRLFIARRNKKGKTQIERLNQKTQSKMKLSELWTKGFIGGIPDNF